MKKINTTGLAPSKTASNKSPKSKKLIHVAIVGGAGYTGGEAIRLLINHPNVEIAWVHSNSNGGNLISDVHSDLFGDTNLRFTDVLNWSDVDCVFLCVGHGDARKFVTSNEIPQWIKIIDLSQDFRIEPNTDGFVYGLCEMNIRDIKKADKISNPGCFATALQLALLPLAHAKMIKSDVHISAVTGSTGAGQSLSTTSHFSWRENNMSIYKAFTHQHIREVNQMLKKEQTFKQSVNFIPYRGDFTRGIIANIYTDFEGTIEEAYQIFEHYYKTAAFTHVSRKPIALKQVVNTNKCLISLEKHDGKLLITSVIDNLLKGASGQAVQNMNIMFGCDQTAGLRLKPQAF